MSKALIYATNPGAQAVVAGGNIALGSISRRYGNQCCNPIIDLNGFGITISDDGYYRVAVDVTALPTAAGPVTITLLQDGVAVQAKTGTAAAAGNPVALSLASPVVRVRCGFNSTLTLQLTAGAGNVSNVGMSVVKE